MVRDTFHQTRLHEDPSSLDFNASKNGAPTTSVGNLFQCLTTEVIAIKLIENKSSYVGYKSMQNITFLSSGE